MIAWLLTACQNGQELTTASNISDANDDLSSDLDGLPFSVEDDVQMSDGYDQGINDPMS